MGFVVYEDRLRIPSNKKVFLHHFCYCFELLFKICQVGMKRTYLPAEEAAFDKKRKEFLQAHCCQAPSTDNNSRSCDTGNGQWAEKFTPRCSVEPVKNCTLVKRDAQEEIVLKLTSFLLQTQNTVQSEKGPWNRGGDDLMYLLKYLQYFLLGRITLKEAAKLIDSSLLLQLRQEHGGLQTLLRNHYQVFVGEYMTVQFSSFFTFTFLSSHIHYHFCCFCIILHQQEMVMCNSVTGQKMRMM